VHNFNEEMRGEIFMTRNTLNFKQLIEKNKEELKNDHKALEKIEKRLDSKYLKIKA
jgi:chaperonin cofactor prefoldin